MGLGDQIREGLAEDLEQEAARKIISALDKWRMGGKIATAQKRWVFELIQNAIDTAKGLGKNNLKIELTSDDSKVIFRHNGGYFEPRELRALLYAYSTKPYERESEFTGRFATGFLVTHIVSRRVEVSSFVDKDKEIYSFKAILDRTSDEISQLSKRIKDSFEQINNAAKVNANTEFWTEYIYDDVDHYGKKAIEEGVLELKKTIPFLFAFNNIDCITINNEPFERPKEEDDTCISIGREQVWLRKDGDIELGILLNNEANTILDLKVIPKIFVKGLPL